jgi:hypothetical protein
VKGGLSLAGCGRALLLKLLLELLLALSCHHATAYHRAAATAQ